MSLFKNKNVAQRELKRFDEKIKLIFESGVPNISVNTPCELAIASNEIILNPLSGAEHKIHLSISQIKSVSVLPWGEFARKYQNTNAPISNTSPGRVYLVIHYGSTANVPSILCFWGALQFLQIDKFAKKIADQLPAEKIIL